MSTLRLDFVGLFRHAVYPRVYGGTPVANFWSLDYEGLSPRVRGNQHRPVAVLLQKRSIPACTGEPDNVNTNRGQPRVYPRVYGGTLGRNRHSGGTGGLSPRVRGNRQRLKAQEARERSIPACTGEPEFLPVFSFGQAVYPRVYGGTLFKKSKAYLMKGLSPRVRGNRG